MKTKSNCRNRPNEKGIYRRDLFKLAVAAGTGLFVTGCSDSRESTVHSPVTPAAKPTGVQTHPAEDFSRMAYCGIKCRTSCPEKEYPEHCGGCKSEDGKLGHFCSVCAIRKCASEKQILTCAHCDEYPSCEVDTWTKYPVLRDMIDKIRGDLKSNPEKFLSLGKLKRKADI